MKYTQTLHSASYTLVLIEILVRLSLITQKDYKTESFRFEITGFGWIRMVKAYVLIKTESGEEDEVLKEILDLTVTEEAHKVFGPFDIIAEVRGRDMESLVEVITRKIRRIKGVNDTQSLMAIDDEIDLSSSSLAT